jgi:beta-mannosidase
MRWNGVGTIGVGIGLICKIERLTICFPSHLREWCLGESRRTYWPELHPRYPIEPNGQRQGDAHYWDVWHKQQPFTAYRDQYPRFMSEFGFQALPPLETIRTFADEADWNMTSYIMEQHQKNASGNSLMVGQMLDTFRLPKNFPSVYLSMVFRPRASAMAEHWRRHMIELPHAHWQPMIVGRSRPESLDYFGRWKRCTTRAALRTVDAVDRR